MAIVKNLTIDQYSTWEKTFTLYDKTHSPFDLSNYNVFADIKKFTNTSKLASFSCEILSPPTMGKIVLSLEYDSISDLKQGQYVYDILLVHKVETQIKIRAVEGTILISGNITT